MSEPIPIGLTQTLQVLQQVDSYFEKARKKLAFGGTPQSLDSESHEETGENKEEETK